MRLVRSLTPSQNRVLSNHTTMIIYGNVNYVKTFLQDTSMNVFDRRAPGGKNAVWKLTVSFEMHSGKPAKPMISGLRN
jgi:hypothetical protein